VAHQLGGCDGNVDENNVDPWTITQEAHLVVFKVYRLDVENSHGLSIGEYFNNNSEYIHRLLS